MNWLKGLMVLFVVSLIGNMTRMYLTHSMSAIDKNMQKVVAEISPKLPMNNDIGLTVTRVTYNSPTMRQYFSIPRGIDPERDYKQQLVDAACNDQTSWMFKKGLRIENIFQQTSAPSSITLDLGMPDITIVVDEKQCEHRGEARTYVASAVPSTASINPARPSDTAPQMAQAVTEAPAVVTAAPAAPSDTAAAVY